MFMVEHNTMPHSDGLKRWTTHGLLVVEELTVPAVTAGQRAAFAAAVARAARATGAAADAAYSAYSAGWAAYSAKRAAYSATGEAWASEQVVGEWAAAAEQVVGEWAAAAAFSAARAGVTAEQFVAMAEAACKNS
jgi:hypothetical protein